MARLLSLGARSRAETPRLALAAALAAIWTGPSAEARPPGNAAEPPAPVHIAPGAAGAYEGTVTFTRSSGSTVADTTRHDAKLVHAAREGVSGPVQLLI
ncbi:MAG TPA: hypothetical protein VMT52_02105, partial [Planctomycetota bacterium]|nr:hypothetical protein [Planctomycetota bacterium]